MKNVCPHASQNWNEKTALPPATTWLQVPQLSITQVGSSEAAHVRGLHAGISISSWLTTMEASKDLFTFLYPFTLYLLLEPQSQRHTLSLALHLSAGALLQPDLPHVTCKGKGKRTHLLISTLCMFTVIFRVKFSIIHNQPEPYKLSFPVYHTPVTNKCHNCPRINYFILRQSAIVQTSISTVPGYTLKKDSWDKRY